MNLKEIPKKIEKNNEAEDKYASLEKIEAECWTQIANGCLKGKDPFHCFVLGTNSDFGVDLRTVVLRKVEGRKLFFHTDIRSPKVAQLKQSEFTSILFYDPARRIQLRIKAQVAFHQLDEISESLWQETRLSARKYYLSESPPGTELDSQFDTLPEHLHGFDPERSESEKGKENFLVVSLQALSIDWLFLHSQGHKRAIIQYLDSGYKANWINP